MIQKAMKRQENKKGYGFMKSLYPWPSIGRLSCPCVCNRGVSCHIKHRLLCVGLFSTSTMKSSVWKIHVKCMGGHVFEVTSYVNEELS